MKQQRDHKRINKQKTIEHREIRAEAFIKKHIALIPSFLDGSTHLSVVRNYRNAIGL